MAHSAVDAALDAEILLADAPPRVREAMMLRYGNAESWAQVAARTGTNREAIRMKCKRFELLHAESSTINDLVGFAQSAAAGQPHTGDLSSTIDDLAQTVPEVTTPVPEIHLQNPNYSVQPRYWVPELAVRQRLSGRWDRGWLFGWRDITNAGNERTVIASVIPRQGAGHKFPLAFSPLDPRLLSCLIANLDSFALDYCARQKLGGTSLTYLVLKQLPAFGPGHYDTSSVGAFWPELRAEILDRVCELTYTAWELEPFANDCDHDGSPLIWNGERRFLLRCELDAAFFHLYLPAEANGDWRPAERETSEDMARLKASFPTPRDAVGYIMDTFPIVKRNDESMWNGDYRTKRVILEVYDAMAEAIRTGVYYQTRLSPPPADAAVAHRWPVELPQQLQTLPDPLAELSAVANAAWGTPIGISPDNVALFTLIEVMRILGGPVDSERVRVASNLVRSPAIAAAFMDEGQAGEWIRVIGQDAKPLTGNVIQISQFQQGTPDLPWAEALRQLRGSGAIVVGTDGKWSSGSKLQSLPQQDWIVGRAAVAVQLLSAIEAVVAERKVLAFIRSVEDGTARRAVS